jgi:hypothetical protein
LVMVPSTIDSPIWGMMISVAIIPFRRPEAKIHDGQTEYYSVPLGSGRI